MTRLEALKAVLLNSQGHDPFGLKKAEHQIIQAMIEEVEAIPDVVTHATRVLHGAGCVPLVWGNAADVLVGEDDHSGVSGQAGEEELREASGRLAKAWDEAVSDELNALVEETLQVAVATA